MANTQEEARATGQGNGRRGLARGAAMMAGLFVLAVLAQAALLHGFYSFTASCDREERAVLGEFPQPEAAVRFGGGGPVPASVVSERTKSKPPPPEGEGPTLGCQVSYQTGDSKEQVYEYFCEQLSVHGWTLVEPPPAQETDEPVLVLAHRGSFSYEVAAFEAYTGSDEPATHVRSTVWESSEETR